MGVILDNFEQIHTGGPGTLCEFAQPNLATFPVPRGAYYLTYRAWARGDIRAKKSYKS